MSLDYVLRRWQRATPHREVELGKIVERLQVQLADAQRSAAVAAAAKTEDVAQLQRAVEAAALERKELEVALRTAQAALGRAQPASGTAVAARNPSVENTRAVPALQRAAEAVVA
jgi:hypothetical protein